MEWRDIGTAPKDESRFFAIGKTAGGEWTGISEICWNIWLDSWADHPAPNEWCDTHGVAHAKAVRHPPTHWMPLPEPPNADEET
jgi:hypothetical protein